MCFYSVYIITVAITFMEVSTIVFMLIALANLKKQGHENHFYIS